MNENENRNNGEFITRRPVRKQQQRRQYSSGKQKKRVSGVSSILSVCAVMLCCVLVLSIAFFDEPYVQTMTGSVTAEGETIGQQILGRLVYLCERFVSVFTGGDTLATPIDGMVVSAFSETDGYVGFSGKSGAEVFAVASGRVSAVYSDDSGVIVEVRHGDGGESKYCALSESVVEVDQPVECGDVLGITQSGKLMLFYKDAGGYCDPLPLMGLKSR